MQAGELDQRISFQRASEVRDDAGGSDTTWSEFARRWAKVVPMKGRERQNAQREEAVADYVITIRDDIDLLESDRIVAITGPWAGRGFNIRFLRQQGRTAYLEIEAELGVMS